MILRIRGQLPGKSCEPIKIYKVRYKKTSYVWSPSDCPPDFIRLAACRSENATLEIRGFSRSNGGCGIRIRVKIMPEWGLPLTAEMLSDRLPGAAYSNI